MSRDYPINGTAGNETPTQASTNASSGTPREIAFIDPSIPDLDAFLRAIRPGVDVSDVVAARERAQADRQSFARPRQSGCCAHRGAWREWRGLLQLSPADARYHRRARGGAEGGRRSARSPRRAVAVELRDGRGRARPRFRRSIDAGDRRRGRGGARPGRLFRAWWVLGSRSALGAELAASAAQRARHGELCRGAGERQRHRRQRHHHPDDRRRYPYGHGDRSKSAPTISSTAMPAPTPSSSASQGLAPASTSR